MALTIEACRANIGRGVVYRPFGGHAEDGVITSVGDIFVFVRYAGDVGSKATTAADLDWLSDHG